MKGLIDRLTTEEKTALLHAAGTFKNGDIPRFNIPSLMMSDGPHGVREEIHEYEWKSAQKDDDFVTYLPSGTALASTWNTQLAYRFGEILGNECKSRGKDLILGPAVNIQRTPLCGRNFEYFSEDPYLTARIAVPYIKGVQDQEVGACVKHFAANNQEQNRLTVNVEMDERTLREIYLPAFEAAVKESQVLAVMSAYNRFRGEFCSHHKYLLKDILRKEWQYNGLIISDWGAAHDTLKAAFSGLDIEMGSNVFNPLESYDDYYFGKALIKKINNREIPGELIDEKILHIFWALMFVKKFGYRTEGKRNTQDHQHSALAIARESIVLLKNKDHKLPLAHNAQKIAVIGDNATRKHARTGGSSAVKALYEVTPLEGLKNIVKDPEKLSYASGYKPLPDKNKDTTESLIQEAEQTAAKADMAIVFGGLLHAYDENDENRCYETEEHDRPDMHLPFSQDELIKRVYQANPNTIIIITSASAVDMSQWIDDIPAVIQYGYCGMEGGNALAGILFGETNPSGKLPYSIPYKLDDSPAHNLGEYPGRNGIVKYNEGLYLGYRYFDTYNINPLFPFGHGLSYTSFAYSGLQLFVNDQYEELILQIEMGIKNTGEIAGAETVQFYIHDQESFLERPYKELKGFEKIYLLPGESQKIQHDFFVRDMAFFDDKKMAWVVEPGWFTLMAGSSSQDIRLEGSFQIGQEYILPLTEENK